MSRSQPPPFPDGFFEREDDSADERFYVDPRRVTHIDDGAIDACRDLYRELLPAGGQILDLMSSWRSHLPQDVSYSSVVGLGMNLDEMTDNPQLSKQVVHNLNQAQPLPFAGESFDGAVCTVSVQYMTRPIETFTEVARVLRPNTPFIVTFSNRCFPTKAIAAWSRLSDADHGRLVQLYFERSGRWRDINFEERRKGVYGVADPLYAVHGYRAGDSVDNATLSQ